MRTITIFVLLSIIMLCCSVEAVAEVKPYLSSPTSTSIWVSWKTASETETKVEFGTSADNLDKEVTGSYDYLGSNYFWHTAKITGLEPNKPYYYRTISGSEVSGVYRFRTQPQEGTDTGHFRFAIIGDHQDKDGDRYHSLVEACKAKILEKYASGTSDKHAEDYIRLVINDGDQVNTGNLENYEKLQFGQSEPLMGNIPFMTVPGNHELHQDTNLERYAAHYVYNDLSYQGIYGGPGNKGEQFYAFQVANILFVMINSNLAANQEQYDWIDDIVEKADADPSVEWVFAVNHHCFYNEQMPNDGKDFVRDGYGPRLAKTDKYVMHITGHAHLYARGSIRNHPCHVIINGGASWDQHWGEVASIEYQDVQKTIERQIFQLVDIDLEKREMRVETYSNGTNLSPGFREDVLLDEFYMKLDAPKPEKPSIVNTVSEIVELPFTFNGSQYVGQEPLNSVEFQVTGKDKNFNDPEHSYKTDFENLYLSSGSPNYTPIDQNAGKDITKFTLNAEDVFSGKKYLRMRYRDQSLHWSEWSEPVEFTVSNGKTLPPQCPVLRYELKNGGQESLSSGLDGTFNAGVSLIDDADKNKKVAKFNNNGMITISSGSTTNLELPQKALSVSCWVKLNSTDNWGGIVGLFQDNGYDEYGWLLGTRNNNFSFALAAGGGLNYLTAPSTLNLGEWYHVTGTFDGSTQKLFINGELEATTSNSGEINYPASGWFQIGSYKDNNEDFGLDGRVSDVIIWERAITQTDAMNLFKNTIPPCVDFNADLKNVSVGGQVNFSDLSQFTPENYTWYFDGGTPETSNEKNPVVSYNTMGAYNVKLVATNINGSDELLRELFINVGTVGIDDTGINNSLIVYPNPVKDKLYLKASNSNFNQLEVLNSMGELVFEKNKGNVGLKIDVQNLSPGLYFVRLYDGDGNFESCSFIKH